MQDYKKYHIINIGSVHIENILKYNAIKKIYDIIMVLLIKAYRINTRN